MNIIAIITGFLIVIFLLIYIYINLKRKKNNELITQNPETTSQKISYLPIHKTNKGKINFQDDFTFDISSITKKQDELDILITFQNNSPKHIRIDILKTTLFSKNESFIGDHQLKELSMGTNDIILKNTILSGGNLIRNIYFTNPNIDDFKSDISMKIELLINNEPYILENSIEKSTVENVKVITE